MVKQLEIKDILHKLDKERNDNRFVKSHGGQKNNGIISLQYGREKYLTQDFIPSKILKKKRQKKRHFYKNKSGTTSLPADYNTRNINKSFSKKENNNRWKLSEKNWDWQIYE